jgi:uncharacterized membrane protein YeaQ/YmgE (transglycosylase-associated protein family)
MSIIVFIVVVLFVGCFASRVFSRDGLGIPGDVVVGIIGALVGGYIFDALGVTDYGEWSTLGTSVLGAVIFLGIVGLFSTGDASSTTKT